LKGHDFRLLWTGAAISLVGDGVFLVALAWQVYSMSEGVTGMAWAGVALAAPQLVLFPLGGLLADRVDRRLVMFGSDIVRAACLLLLSALAWTDRPPLLLLYAVVAVYGAATGVFGPSFDAIIPELVPPDELTNANALDQLIRPIGLRLLGPALGGGIIAVAGTGGAFLLDAASFGVSAMLLLALPRTSQTRTTTTVLEDLREGVVFVCSQPWLWATLSAGAVGLLFIFGPSEVLLPYLVKEVFDESAGHLGLVYASGGLGAIAAAIMIGHTGLPRRLLTLAYLAWGGATLAVAGYGLASSSAGLAVACFIAGAGEAAGMVAWSTAKQRLVPLRLLGRVSSVDWFVSTALVPLSYAITAPIVGVLGAQATFVWAGLVGGCLTLAFLVVPDVRDAEARIEVPSGAALEVAGFHPPRGTDR
jgi:MFS family permease